MLFGLENWSSKHTYQFQFYNIVAFDENRKNCHDFTETSVNKVLTLHEGQVPVELELKIQVRSHCHHLLVLPDLLIWTVVWYFTVRWLFGTHLCQIYARTVYAELKQNRKWRQNGKCCMTQLRCVIVIEKQSKWRRFAYKLPRQSFLDVFLAEKD